MTIRAVDTAPRLMLQVTVFSDKAAHLGSRSDLLGDQRVTGKVDALCQADVELYGIGREGGTRTQAAPVSFGQSILATGSGAASFPDRAGRNGRRAERPLLPAELFREKVKFLLGFELLEEGPAETRTVGMPPAARFCTKSKADAVRGLSASGWIDIS